MKLNSEGYAAAVPGILIALIPMFFTLFAFDCDVFGGGEDYGDPCGWQVRELGTLALFFSCLTGLWASIGLYKLAARHEREIANDKDFNRYRELCKEHNVKPLGWGQWQPAPPAWNNHYSELIEADEEAI